MCEQCTRLAIQVAAERKRLTVSVDTLLWVLRQETSDHATAITERFYQELIKVGGGRTAAEIRSRQDRHRRQLFLLEKTADLLGRYGHLPRQDRYVTIYSALVEATNSLEYRSIGSSPDDVRLEYERKLAWTLAGESLTG